jgi:hypothetical protein
MARGSPVIRFWAGNPQTLVLLLFLRVLYELSFVRGSPLLASFGLESRSIGENG